MDPQQTRAYNDSIMYCNSLITQLEQEKDTIRSCFHGEPLKAYLEVTDMAIQRAKKLRSSLQYLQQMQP